MDDKSVQELKVIGDEVGIDLLSLITKTAEQRKSELDGKVDHKSTEVQPVAQTTAPAPAEVAPVAASAEPITPSEQKSDQPLITDAQLTTIADKLATAFGLQKLSDTLSGLQDALTKQQGEVAAIQKTVAEQKEADEKRLAEKAQSLPNFESFSWLRPSTSPTTLMAADDKLKSAKPRIPEAITRLSSE